MPLDGVTRPSLDPAVTRRPTPFREASRKIRRLSAGIAAPGRGWWALVLILIGLDAVWAAAAGIAVEHEGLAIVAGTVAALLLGAACLARVISDPPLRGMMLGSAFLLAFTVPVALLHYLAAGLDRPFVDATLAAWEAALGFDWTGYVGFLAEHPALSWWLALVYHSSGPGVGLVVIVLGATRRLGRLWSFLRLFALTLLIVVAVSAAFPALGPYAHYAPRTVPGAPLDTVGALWHLDPVARLRAGTLHRIALGDLRGLATFPSFHVCLAILTAWALAPVRVLGRAMFVVETLVVFGTVGAGGHYLPDLLAGAALALGALAWHAWGSRSLPLRQADAGGGGAVAAPAE